MKKADQLEAAFAMPFAVRPLATEDTRRSGEIERDAFPSLTPPTSFHRELKNKKANYLIAHVPPTKKRLLTNHIRRQHPRGASFRRTSTLIRTQPSLAPCSNRHATDNPVSEIIVGFEGTWYMADEAHIITVGVAREYRGKGVGELLLLAALKHAIIRGSTFATLEVRPSNGVARSLYLKYGFSERGTQKNYYSDNRENAIIMTTDHIQSREFQDHYSELRKNHELRWGSAAIKLE